MANKIAEPYLEPVSEGICKALGCSHPAKYRASWSMGVVRKIVCTTHMSQIEGKPFEPSLFRAK